MLTKQQLLEIFKKYRTFFVISFISPEFYANTLLVRHPELATIHKELQNIFQHQALIKTFSLPAYIYKSNSQRNNLLILENETTKLAAHYRNTLLGSTYDKKIPGGLLIGSVGALDNFLSENQLILDYMLRKFPALMTVIDSCQTDLQIYVQQNRDYVESLCKLVTTKTLIDKKNISLTDQDLNTFHEDLVKEFSTLDLSLPIEDTVDYIYENYLLKFQVKELINQSINDFLHKEKLPSEVIEKIFSNEFYQTVFQKIEAIKTQKNSASYKQLVMNTINALVEMEIYYFRLQTPTPKKPPLLRKFSAKLIIQIKQKNMML